VLARLYGTGDFEHVNYRLLEEPGKHILAVDAVEKSWGPNYLRLGLGLSTDFRGDAYFNLLASHRMTWLNSLGGEWRNDFQVGKASRIATEFYQPVERSQTFFVVPSASYGRRTVDIFSANQRVARYDIQEGLVAAEVGAQFTRYGELRFGIESSDARITLDTGPPQLLPTRERAQYVGLTLKGLADQLDNVNFPRSGYGGWFQITTSRTALGGDADFVRGEASGQYVTSFGEHTFEAAFKAGGRLSSHPLPANQLFQWGGLLQQSGYATGALIGEELMFARLGYRQRIARWSLLEGMYAGVSLEVGRMRRPLVPDNEQGILHSAAVTLGVDTPVGPLYLGYGRVLSRGYSSVYLFLGRP